MVLNADGFPSSNNNNNNNNNNKKTTWESKRFLPGTAPARPEHTEIYIVQRSHSILLLGKNDFEFHE